MITLILHTKKVTIFFSLCVVNEYLNLLGLYFAYFFLYIYVVLYKLYVLFCVCLFALLQFCTMGTRNK